MSGVKKCGDPPGIIEAVPQLEAISQNDPVKKIRYIAKESLLLIRMSQTSRNQEPQVHLEIVRELGNMKSMRGLPRLQEMFDKLMVEVEALPDFEEGIDIEDLEPADAEALVSISTLLRINTPLTRLTAIKASWVVSAIYSVGFARICSYLDGVGSCDYVWSDGCHQIWRTVS